MNIGTTLQSKVKGTAAEGVAERYQQVADNLKTGGIQVEKTSSEEAVVTIDSATLKADSNLQSTVALSKRMEAAGATRDAAFSKGQAARERSNASEDRAEARSAENEAKEAKAQVKADQESRARVEAEIQAQEKIRKEAEQAAFSESLAAKKYRTHGESMLADAAGDPIKIAQAMDKIELATQHEIMAQSSKLKAHSVDDLLAGLKARVSRLGENIEDLTDRQGFLAETAQRALASAAERDASAANSDKEAAQKDAEASRLEQEADLAVARSEAQSAVAAATDAKAMKAVAGA